ncbi:ribonuclease H [Senna tora]|uniref:Ribonuclease H n=1 Tax=Senna tora TaxID=362788 RepID=A0A834XGQ3_9FABA|nr:ribonuclease H [Senna tora]
MMKKFSDIYIRHIFREANQCADGLAKLGSHNQILFRLWECPPPEISLALLADLAGTSFRENFVARMKHNVAAIAAHQTKLGSGNSENGSSA